MTTSKKQSGFSAIELLITLFIAAAFLVSGFQLYNLIIKDGGQTRAQARASNVLYDYLQRYKPNAGSPCPAGGTRTPVNNQAINVTSLSNVTITVTISCPYSSGAYTTKTLVTLKYNYGTGTSSSQETISNATFSPAQAPCPTGFIVVPGSTTYGTSDFCVMKYEAKNAGGNVPISQAAGTPWVNVPQELAGANNDAKEYSTNVAGCAGCHLITETEWLTIAQNVLSVAGNWSGGAVGNGYIYGGNSDDDPGITGLTADSNDSNGYAGTNNNAGDSTITNGMVGDSQRRVLTLTNGEVIWDLAGNVWEWTSSTTTGDQPGIIGEGEFTAKEWTDITTPGTLSPNPSPTATGISDASTWDSSKGIGQLYSDSGDTTLRGFLRGGGWWDASGGGVLALVLAGEPSGTNIDLGFRASR